jgi:hypothetical protein
MTYGERFRELRLARAKKGGDKRAIAVAKDLGNGYPSSVYNIEQMWRVPNLKTIARHAKLLGCEPWDLLIGVTTEYDTARDLSKLPGNEAKQRWQDLIRRTTRGKKAKSPPDVRTVKRTGTG